jgi:hypothetical protein
MLYADGGHQEPQTLPQKDPTDRGHQARGACKGRAFALGSRSPDQSGLAFGSKVSCTCLFHDLQALFVGSSITIYSRQLKLIDYGDDYTRAQLEAKSERYTAGLLGKQKQAGKPGKMLGVSNITHCLRPTTGRLP